MLDIDVETLALEEELQIGIMLQHRMRRNLVQHPLQRLPPALDEIAFEATDGLFLGRRGHDDAGAVSVEGVVEP